MSKISEIQNPHDYFIKSVFADLKTARSFLENYLPPEIVARLDFETLLARGESFVDENLKPSHTDLLYRVNFNANENFALIYVLLEHKSYADEWTAFQLLRYAVRIWEKEQRDGAKRLPIIVPLVLYHGKNNWRVDTKFSALVENGDDVDFAAFTPHFIYQLCDLSTIEESDLRGAITLRVSMSVLKYIFRPELPTRLAEIFEILKDSEHQSVVEFLGIVLRYLSAAKGKVSTTQIRRALKIAFPVDEGEIMKTFSEEWIEEGIAKGLQRGQEIGLQQGLQQGLAKQILRSLTRQIGEIDNVNQQEIYELSVEKLEKLGDEMFDFNEIKDLRTWLEANLTVEQTN